MSVQSRHSARIVAMTRSAWALAFGARIGVRITLAPSERTTSSKGPTNLVSRSWMRNRIAVDRSSRFRARLRACWLTHAESGWTVEALRWIRLLPSSMNSRT